MPNKLEATLSRCSVDMVRKSVRALKSAGLSLDEISDILDELEGWLAWKEHAAPDVFEGPSGWYRFFYSFVIEGEAGATCPAIIRLKRGWKPKRGAVDLDRPETWVKRL